MIADAIYTIIQKFWRKQLITNKYQGLFFFIDIILFFKKL